ncbi:MAG: ATP-binding protein [Casimicrobium sp.]
MSEITLQTREFPVLDEKGNIVSMTTRQVEVFAPVARAAQTAPRTMPQPRKPEQPKPAAAWQTQITAVTQRLEALPNLQLPLDHKLPTCPVCNAAAFHTAHANAFDLEHDCKCSNTQTERYFAGLEMIWAKRRNTENFTRGLPDVYRAYSFAGLEITPENKPAITAAKNLEPGGFLYLHGEPGNGKTRLAVATAKRLISSRHTARYANCPSLKGELMAAFKNRTALPDFYGPDILILDDLDKISPSAWMFEILFAAIDHRWSNKKTTIFTCQHAAGWVAKYHALLEVNGQTVADAANANAMLSRMASGAVIRVVGRDHRVGAT